MATGPRLKRLAILVGGGPAPGINGVISAVTLEALNHGIEVYGIQDGNLSIMNGVDTLIKTSGADPAKVTDLAEWIKAGNCKHVRRLCLETVVRVPFKGGSMLGTSRANPTKDPANLQNVLDFYKRLGADALVSIGGDDTAYSASQVHKKGGGSIRVAHVPKTIDNDLPLPGSTPTFGFDTARSVGTKIIRDLAEDARTTTRWYIVVSMGRAAGHLALGIGKASAATITVIPEEFKKKKLTVAHLTDILVGCVLKRAALDRRYGVMVLAEGLIEALDEEELFKTISDGNGAYGIVERDPFGNLRMGEIEFGRLMRDLVTEGLKPYKMKPTFVDKELGYELRCADPTPFDCEYTRDLGYGAVKFLLSSSSTQFGAVISFVNGSMNPLPFDSMLSPVTHRMQTRPVDVAGEGYDCARRYMTRLEKSDFEDAEMLGKVAAAAKMMPEEFKKRFGYLTEA